MAIATPRKRARFNVKLVYPSGPEVIRLVHHNVTANHRAGKDSSITLPALVARAQMIVNETRLMPIQNREE